MDGPSSGPYEDRTRTAATVLAVLGRHEGIKSCRLDGEGRARRYPTGRPPLATTTTAHPGLGAAAQRLAWSGPALAK